jgi:hypothetical protein
MNLLDFSNLPSKRTSINHNSPKNLNFMDSQIKKIK